MCFRVSVKESFVHKQNASGYLVDGCLVVSGFSLAHFAQQGWQKKQIKYPVRPIWPFTSILKHLLETNFGAKSVVNVWHKQNRLHLSAEPPLANNSSLRPIYCLDLKQESAIKW